MVWHCRHDGTSVDSPKGGGFSPAVCVSTGSKKGESDDESESSAHHLHIFETPSPLKYLEYSAHVSTTQ